MDEQTLTALKGSIAKWESIVAGTGEDLMAANCPLCQRFNNRDVEECCVGCPVMDQTGYPDCTQSPYWNYYFQKTTKNAQAELDFLKSLLPDEPAADTESAGQK